MVCTAISAQTINCALSENNASGVGVRVKKGDLQWGLQAYKKASTGKSKLQTLVS